VRTLSRVSTLTAALTLAVACGRDSQRPTSAVKDDLKRDLQLASSPGLNLANQQRTANYALTETPELRSPTPARTIRKKPGPKAIRSDKPTVKGTPEETVAAEAPSTQTETVEMAPAPLPTTETVMAPSAPAVPRPTAIPVSGPMGATGSGIGRGTDGPGDGVGVIIRGGGIGDDDHCEPMGRRRGRNYPYPRYPGTVFNPSPRGIYNGGYSGLGGGRFPTATGIPIPRQR
jgi:hypothetical protein